MIMSNKNLKNIWSILLLFVGILNYGCTEDLPPTLIEFINNSELAWKVTSFSVDGASKDSSLVTDVRYIFEVDAEGNPTNYSVSSIDGTIMDGTGWRPDYYAEDNEGTWNVQANNSLIFETADGKRSYVTVEADPSGILKLSWTLPEDFSKIFPEVKMTLSTTTTP